LQAAGCKTDLEQHKDFVIDVGANPAAFVRMKRGCSAASPAAIYEFQTRIYYVSNESIPTLRLLTLSGTSSTNEPMVQGIESLRLEYGRDNVGNNGMAEDYRKCLTTGDPCVTADWANMVSVRVNLLARDLAAGAGHSDTKVYALGAGAVVGPFNDHFRRHAYTMVVRLMNPAGRREL
jgi:type IV pilus assembly protein PilW